MNLLIRITVLCLVIIISDVFFYKLLKCFFVRNDRQKKILKTIVLFQTVVFILFEAGCYIVVGYPMDDPVKYRELFAPLSVFILVYVPKFFSAIFLLLYDLVVLLFSKFFRAFRNIKNTKKPAWIHYWALLVLLLVFSYCLYGFVYEKTNVKIVKVDLHFKKLPKAFDGFKIVQITDVHLGSFKNPKTIEHFINEIKGLSPDMLVMTGDMINVSDKELDPYYSSFNGLNPPNGKYSILGNHDIGDYFKLKDPPNQAAMTKKLIAGEKKMGFIVLIDSACYIRKDGDSISLLGVNNCGTFPFKKSGNLEKTLKYARNEDFKILLSHDPNHWTQEVCGRTNIDLTLSGHTHAMQIAILTKLFRFSPSRFIYKRWCGQYEMNNQMLYVNPGLGFSGFSARIGIRPEITLLTLHTTN